DAVRLDLCRDSFIGEAHGHAPMIGQRPKALRTEIWPPDLCVAEHLDRLAIVRGEEWLEEPRNRMLAEIAGHVTDSQSPVGRAVVGVSLRPRPWLAVPLVPFPMRGEKLSGREPLIIEQTEQQIAVCRHEIRLYGEGAFEFSDRQLQMALVLEHGARVLVRLGSARLKSERATIVLDRLVQLSLSLKRVAEIIVHLGSVRLEPQRLPILRLRPFQLTLILECCGKTDVCLDTFG